MPPRWRPRSSTGNGGGRRSRGALPLLLFLISITVVGCLYLRDWAANRQPDLLQSSPASSLERVISRAAELSSKVTDEVEAGGCEAHTALYSTIYQDLTPWLTRGIHKEDFDPCPDQYGTMSGFLHFAIIDDELYVTTPPMPPWLNGLYFLSLGELQEVVYQGGLPNMRFVLQLSDWPQVPVPQYRKDGNDVPLGQEKACPLFNWVKDHNTMDILIPDGDFMKHHFDEWLANNTDPEPAWAPPWDERDSRAVGRYTNFPTGRRSAAKRGQVTNAPRDYYSGLSDRTNRSHFDVGMVEQRGWLPIAKQLGFKYALSLDGNTASTRFQMLLATDQTALKQASSYYQYFESALVPWVHYVPIGEYDPDDILPIVEWLRQHDDVARRIAKQGQAFARRHLTKAARLCYYRRLLEEYGSLFRYQPQLTDFANITRLSDEVRAHYNSTEGFHTVHGASFLEFFRAKDGPWDPPGRIQTPFKGDPGYVPEHLRNG